MTCSDILAGAARRGSSSLSADARSGIAGFVLQQRHADGGFRGRAAASDLYYTYFAVQTLKALDRPVPPAVAGYLDRVARDLPDELVNLACLAALSAGAGLGEAGAGAVRRIDAFRDATGGFREKRDGGGSTPYACFLAVLAHEAQGVSAPDAGLLAASVRAMAPSVTPAIAARAILLSCLDPPPDPADRERLMGRLTRKGGFKAAAFAPIPDLLSTATALCALGALGAPVGSLKDSCAEFVESLWDESGGFRGHWADRVADCEYTYYALLSLGMLAGA